MEGEYVIVQQRITEAKYGVEVETILIERSPDPTEEFKDHLWDDMRIDIDRIRVRLNE